MNIDERDERARIVILEALPGVCLSSSNFERLRIAISQSLLDARKEALEEAAKIATADFEYANEAEKEAPEDDTEALSWIATAAHSIAHQIRALKDK